MDAQKIAERLIKLRGKRTQAEVAQALGISPSAYSMYENGERIPRDEIKKKIAAYYRRSVTTIFFAD
jgi:transcriptional regulator with XRE-family HTH domain